MEQLAIALGILAGLVHLAGYWQYHQFISRRDNDPNAASWFMWGVGGGVELFIYDSLVRNWAKDFLPFTCSVGALITFLRMGLRESSFRLDREDLISIAMDAGLVAFYIKSHDVVVSNWLLGLDMILSFLPILRTTWREPAREHPQSWATWTISYTLLAIAVFLAKGVLLELLYPVLYMVLHGTVWAFARYRTVKS